LSTYNCKDAAHIPGHFVLPGVESQLRGDRQSESWSRGRAPSLRVQVLVQAAVFGTERRHRAVLGVRGK